MSALRFSDHSINCFKSYFLNRRFGVNITDTYSCITKIDSGVPQESMLGSLLFLLFVTYMNQAVDCDLFLHAHDPCFVYQHKNQEK